MVALMAFIVLSLIVGVYVWLWRDKKQSMREEFTVWVFFSVALALAPLLFNLLLIWVSGINPTLSDLLGNGELLIVSVAIGADAVGKLIRSGSYRKTFKNASVGGCILLIIVSSLLFAAISKNVGRSLDPERVADSSIIIFLLMIVASGSCILLAEVKE